MKKQKKKNNRERLLLLLILLLAVFLRFSHISELFNWSLDEEYWAYLPYNLATGYHFSLIGGHISGTGLYSGPLFVWLMALPFFIFQGNPAGIAIFVSALGVIAVYLTYYLGKVLFNNRVGLLAAFLQAVSALMVIYDRKYWNASPIPFLSLLTLLCLARLREGKNHWALALAFCLTLAVHAHMTGIVLLIFALISWIFFKLPVKKKQILASGLLFILLQLPLAAFELRHNFLNTRALISFFNQNPSAISLTSSVREVFILITNTFTRLFYLPGHLDLANELTLCNQYAPNKFIPSLILSLPVAAIIFAGLCTKTKHPGMKLLKLLLIVNFSGLIFYRLLAGEGSWYAGQLAEYYLFPSYPALFILAGVFWEKLFTIRSGVKLIPALLLIFLLLNINSVLTLYHSSGYAQKLNTVKATIVDLQNKPFTLEVKGDDLCRIYGYRYLYSYLQNEPVSSYLDSLFSWLYQKRLPQIAPQNKVEINYLDGNTSYIISDY